MKSQTYFSFRNAAVMLLAKSRCYPGKLLAGVWGIRNSNLVRLAKLKNKRIN